MTRIPRKVAEPILLAAVRTAFNTVRHSNRRIRSEPILKIGPMQWRVVAYIDSQMRSGSVMLRSSKP